MGKLRKKWVLEYSETQGAFHVSTLADVRRNNKPAKTDYKPIAVFNSREEADVVYWQLVKKNKDKTMQEVIRRDR